MNGTIAVLLLPIPYFMPLGSHTHTIGKLLTQRQEKHSKFMYEM